MTEKELLNSNFLELPLNRDDNDFPKYVEEYLSNYIERLKKVDGRFSKEINNRLPLITELANGLIESIEKYYIGKTAESYTLFKKAVDTIKPYLDIQLFNINSKDFPVNYFLWCFSHRPAFQTEDRRNHKNEKKYQSVF